MAVSFNFSHATGRTTAHRILDVHGLLRLLRRRPLGVWITEYHRKLSDSAPRNIAWGGFWDYWAYWRNFFRTLEPRFELSLHRSVKRFSISITSIIIIYLLLKREAFGPPTRFLFLSCNGLFIPPHVDIFLSVRRTTQTTATRKETVTARAGYYSVPWVFF
jgi:hypothetical protein